VGPSAPEIASAGFCSIAAGLQAVLSKREPGEAHASRRRFRFYHDRGARVDDRRGHYLAADDGLVLSPAQFAKGTSRALAALSTRSPQCALSREGAMPGFRKMIVVSAFDRGPDGTLTIGFGPRQMTSEETAIYAAQTLINDHVGVVAWSREANTAVGEEGPTIILYQHGEIPEFD
jgi:hypothetical protein